MNPQSKVRGSNLIYTFLLLFAMMITFIIVLLVGNPEMQFDPKSIVDGLMGK